MPVRLPHDCRVMRSAIADERFALSYSLRFREYRIPLQGSAIAQVLFWCPFCGDALPTSLRERWFAEIAGQGLSADDVIDDPDVVPRPYRDDAWWWGRDDLAGAYDAPPAPGEQGIPGRVVRFD